MSRSGERRVGVSAALLAVDLGLRCFGFAAVRRILARGRPSERERPGASGAGAGLERAGMPTRTSEADRATARRLAARVERSASFRVYRVPCLPRALLLERLLTARGLPTRLRIGVRRDGSALRAHAWIECADQVLDADRHVEERFAPLT